MKVIAGFLFCFIAAFMLGRWGMDSQLTKRDREIELLKKEMKQHRINPLGGVTQMLHLEPKKPRSQPEFLEPPERVSTNGTNVVVQAVPRETERPRRRGRRNRDEPMEKRLDAAFELWETRSKIARATFLSNVGATEVEAERFDTLVTGMNLQIEDTIKIWAESVAEQQTVRPEDGARLMHEITGSVVQAYDAIGESMPEGWQDRAGRQFKLFDHIDPNVGRSLIAVEHLLDGRGPW